MNASPLEKLLEERHSVRAFTKEPVARADLERILRAARRAPSGANLQPGHFHVLMGKALEQLSAAFAQAIAQDVPHVQEYSYFPNPMPADRKARQRAAGFALYDALGIDKRDLDGRRRQFELNYRFFDAPVGIVVTIDRSMGAGCFMDLGMSLMALFLAAQELGYGATGIGALANYGPTALEALGLGKDQLVVCGIAIGREDTEHPVNRFRTERDELDTFASFRGFD